MFSKLLERNIKLYYRDRVSVFFSLLSVIIVIGLYILFLAKMQIDGVKTSVGNVVSSNDISWLINSWILAGLLSIISVSSTLGALGIVVHDREEKILKDFKSTPISQMLYPVSAICSSCIVGIVMSAVAFAGYSVFICASTGHMFTVSQILKTLALICVSVFADGAIMAFMVSCFSMSSAFSSASVVVGTVIGFVTGVYVPIGSLPNYVQILIKVLPFGHSASLFRQVLMEDSIPAVFKNAGTAVSDSYKLKLGVQYTLNGVKITDWMSIVFILAVAAVFLILFFLNYRRKRKEI